MVLIDVHCHIHETIFDNDRREVVDRARKNGVKHIITSAIKPGGVDRALRVINEFKGYISLTIGHDPILVDDILFSKQVEYVRKYSNIIVGVGEVGLDYYVIRDYEKRSKQRKFFVEWISIAEELNLPLIVHSRSAGKYAIKEILKYKYFNVVMHAYDGSVGWAMEAAKHGIYFSIPPSVTFSVQKQKLVKKLPLESLLLETDSPVLSPFKGQRNEPVNIIYSAMKIAEIKNISLDKVIEVTTDNALNVFKRLKLKI